MTEAPLFHIKDGDPNAVRRRYMCLSCSKSQSAPDGEFPECCGYPMVGKEFDEANEHLEIDIIRFLCGREPIVNWAPLPGQTVPIKTINEQMDDGRWWSGIYELWALKGLGRQKGERFGWIRVLPGLGWQWRMVPGVTPSQGICKTSSECVRTMVEAIAM